MSSIDKIDEYLSKSVNEGVIVGEEPKEEVLTEAERTFTAIMKEILQLEKAINSGMMDKKSINLVKRQIDKLNDRLLQMEDELAD